MLRAMTGSLRGKRTSDPTNGSNYLNWNYGFQSWLASRDHKRVAWLYFASITLFLLVGGAVASLMRLELMTPAADVVSASTYKTLYTTHGLIMIFFGLIPAVPAVLGNFLLPLMIGAKNMAFPRLNVAGWYLYVAGGLLLLAAFLVGGLGTGWMFYAPYGGMQANLPLLLAGSSIILVSLAMVLLAVNIVVTIHKMRAPGMIWFRLPLFVWSLYAAGLMILVGTPVLALTLMLMMIERLFLLGIFDPALGGDPLLYQHLFWFYGNQTAYVIILPALGIIFEIFAAFSRRRIFGYRALVYAMLSLVFLGFITWAGHMDSSLLSPTVALFSSFFSYLTVVPFAVILLSLVGTLFHGNISFGSPLLFALGAIGLILIGGFSGLALSTLILAEHLHNTAFVTAHLHYAVGAALMAGLGGLHFWWPKITGRIYAEAPAKIAALIIFVGVNLSVATQFALGYLGMPRHAPVYPAEFTLLQSAAGLGTTILLVGYLLPPLYLTWALFFGPQSEANPWQAKGLEWEAAGSPPRQDNFDQSPLVTDEAYHYAG